MSSPRFEVSFFSFFHQSSKLSTLYSLEIKHPVCSTHTYPLDCLTHKHKHQTGESLVRPYRLTSYTFAPCHLPSDSTSSFYLLYPYRHRHQINSSPLTPHLAVITTNHHNGHLPIRYRRPNHHVEEVVARLFLCSCLPPVCRLAARIGSLCHQLRSILLHGFRIHGVDLCSFRIQHRIAQH